MKAASWIFRNAVSESLKDNISLLAAAISYYGLFSLMPMVLILISLGNTFFDGEQIRTTIFFYFEMYLGSEAASFFDLIVDSFADMGNNWWVISVAIIIILYAATNVFTALHEAFEAVYDFDTSVKSPWAAFFLKRALGIISMILMLLVLFFLSNINSLLDVLGETVRSTFSPENAATILQVESTTVSFLVVLGLFALVYKMYSHATVTWKSTFIGAAVGSTLFLTITTLMKMYFSRTETSLFFALAGSVLVALLWVYYVSQGFLFGAEVTKAHDRWTKRLEKKLVK